MSAEKGILDSADQRLLERAHAERDNFISSIGHDDVLALAASYHPSGSKGRFFREPVRGSYNVCYFVHFKSTSRAMPDANDDDDDDGDRWVVRVPLQPMLGLDVKEKINSEVATMRLVAECTEIPIPRIIAHATGDKSKPIHTFLILNYVHGEVLDTAKLRELSAEQKQTLYESLADIYIQLRRLEFSSIGCLAISQNATIIQPRTVFTIDTNDQEISGRNPSQIQAKYIQDPVAGLRSVASYTRMLLDLADNGIQSWAEVTPEHLFNMHIFREYALGWLKPEFDKGPFVLSHGDFDGRNILIDEDSNIVAVLDWEWSHVVPLQFFTPPLWLKTTRMQTMANSPFYDYALREYDIFLEVVRSREQSFYGGDNISLADEWDVAKLDGGFFVPYALVHWHLMDWFAHYSLHFLRGNELESRVEDFMSQDKRRWQAVKKRATTEDAPPPKASSTTIWAQMGSRVQGVYYKCLAMSCHSIWGKAIALTVWGTVTAYMIACSFRCWTRRR